MIVPIPTFLHLTAAPASAMAKRTGVAWAATSVMSPSSLSTATTSTLSSMTALQTAAEPTTILSSSTSFIAAVLKLSGGDARSVLDLTRTRIRLEGLHTYGVMAALLMNVSLRLFSSTPKRMEDANTKREFMENVIKFVFTVCMSTSVLSGSYTTIVFSLLGMYSKRALGMGQDEAYLKFFDATENIRESAFDSFVLSLVTFEASFVLSLFLNYHGRWRWFFLVTAGFAAFVCWWRWSAIMQLAEAILFKTA